MRLLMNDCWRNSLRRSNREFSMTSMGCIKDFIIKLNSDGHRQKISQSVINKVGQNLLLRSSSPLSLTKDRIFNYFDSRNDLPRFEKCVLTNPIVTVQENFDNLLFPEDHPGRSSHDTFYLNSDSLLRTHMTTHEREFLKQGHRSFILAGDVYRRDEIDKTHYPVFHQLEGVRIFSPDELRKMAKHYRKLPVEVRSKIIKQKGHQGGQNPDNAEIVLADLFYTLEGLLHRLFGAVPINWIEAFFPFTHPSLEAEILFGGRHVEVLGCGILEKAVIGEFVQDGSMGWAFGMGIERLAMLLYSIPDIRYFWSEDPRFLKQFENQSATGAPIQFKPYSRYPAIYRDISFFALDGFSPSLLFDAVRTTSDGLVESVDLVDKYHDPRQNLTSLCYRICYRSMDENLTDEQVNRIQQEVRTIMLGCEAVKLR